MAPRTDAEELQTAWRALAGDAAGGEGWRTIPIAAELPVKIRAGRHFPGNSEALLVGFRASHLPPATRLPEGRGFAVSFVELDQPGAATWVCLSRSASGSQDLFATMSADVLNAMAAAAGMSENSLFQLFLARIAAWQYFMEHGGTPVLGEEAEIGLFGELLMLTDLLAAGLEARVCVDAWRGPGGGLHDFELGCGAIEVKSSLSIQGMPVTISSLAQLDSSPSRPLLLAAMRLTLDGTGTTLPELAAAISARMVPYPPAVLRFRSLLLRAGYLETHAEQYHRRFVRQAMRMFAVDEGFPRLTRASVPPEILEAKYELDLDRIIASSVDLLVALHQLGVC
jgi:hypothetical protein